MNIKRAILSGVIIWTMIFSYFTFIAFIPQMKDFELLQHILLWFILIPIVIFGLNFYNKKKLNSIKYNLAGIIVLTCLFLDVIITVPFTIIPQGGSYFLFFTNPFLWILVGEIIIITLIISKTNKQIY